MSIEYYECLGSDLVAGPSDLGIEILNAAFKNSHLYNYHQSKALN
jgi:hypothetical protein